MLKDAR